MIFPRSKQEIKSFELAARMEVLLIGIDGVASNKSEAGGVAFLTFTNKQATGGDQMTTCNECGFFFAIPETADDFEKNKGDCVTEKEDEKGKYWLSKPVSDSDQCCAAFHTRHAT